MNIPAHQILFGFEQDRIDTELARAAAKLQAKLAAKEQRAAQKRQAELDKMHRRIMRDHERKKKIPDLYAVCGIHFYSLSPAERERGCHWTHCHHCGKALRWFKTYEEAQKNNGECKRPSRK
jgi:hypothetical protein